MYSQHVSETEDENAVIFSLFSPSRPHRPGSAQAASARPAGHTGHVPAVREAPAHGGTVPPDPDRGAALRSPRGRGRATAEETRGKEGQPGKLGKTGPKAHDEDLCKCNPEPS